MLIITQKIEKRLKLVLIGLILIYPVFFAFQEGDFTDTGFLLTKYRFFIEDFHENRVASGILLTNALGYLWYLMFPNFGILGYKLLYYLMYLLSFRLAWLFVKTYTEINLINLSAIFVGVVYAERYWNYVFSYDIFGFVLLGYATYYVYGSLVNNKSNINFIYSGLFIALASFARVGNIIFFPLLIIVLSVYFFSDKRKTLIIGLKRIVQVYFYVFIGFIVTVLVVVFWVRNSGFFDAFANGYTRLFKSNSHGGVGLLGNYLSDFYRLLLHSIFCFSLFVLFVVSFKKVFKIKLLFIILCCVLIYLIYFVYFDFGYLAELRYLLPAITLSTLLLNIFKNKLKTLPILFLVFSLAAVAGTNTGLVLKMNYIQLVVLPFSIFSIMNFFKKNMETYYDGMSFFVVMIMVVTFMLSFISAFGWIYHGGDGLKTRLRFVHKIKTGSFKGLYTDNEKSIKICELKSLECKIGGTIFVLGTEPMVYTLLNRNTPIINFWLGNGATNETLLLKDLNSLLDDTKSFSLIILKRKDRNDKIPWFDNVFEKFTTDKKYFKIHDGKNYLVYNIE